MIYILLLNEFKMLTAELFNLIIQKQDEWRIQYKKNRAAYQLQKNREEKKREKAAKLAKLLLIKN
jgi:hypothetical protein